MTALLDQLRRSVASRPLWLFLALLVVSFLIERVVRHRVNAGAGLTFVRIATGASLVYYVALLVWYAAVPQQSDSAEPTMTCVAWLFSLGKPVYHSLASAERYSHMYGPVAFIVPGMVMRLSGPSMLVAKSVGIVAALLGLSLTWLAIRRASDGILSVSVVCGLCVLEFLVFRNLTFWSRPEPLQLAAVGAGLFAAVRMYRAPATVIMAFSVGLLCNLKITGPLYALPIVMLFYTRFGLRSSAVALVGAALVAAMPFAVFSNVSWTDYMLWVRLSARNGLRVAALKENVEWALFVLIPVLVRLSVPVPLPSAMRLVVPALLAGVCGVMVAASKPGAGAHHLVPFLPTIAYVTATAYSGSVAAGRLRWLTPFVATLVFTALIQQQYFWRLTYDSALAGSYRDVDEYISRHPAERVGIGYTSAERMSFARTLTVFKTGQYLLDVPAIQEHQLSGLGLPQATIDAIRSCAVTTWLLPAGGEPFHIRNDYPSTGYSPLFPPEFTAAFYQAYRRDERTRHYDVWRCRAAGS